MPQADSTGMVLYPELQALVLALDACSRDAHAIVDGLSEELGTWQAGPASWSVAQCLDHLATANRVYLGTMRTEAERARARGRRRRRAALPGLPGRLFIWSLEPPPRRWLPQKSPRAILPQQSPGLADAVRRFFESQDDVRVFVHEYADLDLASVRFPNPFVRGIRFSLATGLHVIPAHERRHLLQAKNVRAAAEQAAHPRSG